ncbi:hypothetical protein Vafri_164 [Volvox africanus]|nr:hypothetical protein Vafri_164 [Volvox africanus]
MASVPTNPAPCVRVVRLETARENEVRGAYVRLLSECCCSWVIRRDENPKLATDDGGGGGEAIMSSVSEVLGEAAVGALMPEGGDEGLTAPTAPDVLGEATTAAALLEAKGDGNVLASGGGVSTV